MRSLERLGDLEVPIIDYNFRDAQLTKMIDEYLMFSKEMKDGNYDFRNFMCDGIDKIELVSGYETIMLSPNTKVDHSLTVGFGTNSTINCDYFDGLGDIIPSKYDREYFSGIGSLFVLEHLTMKDINYLFYLCRRLLKNGGKMLHVIPDMGIYSKLYGGKDACYEDYEKLQYAIFSEGSEPDRHKTFTDRKLMHLMCQFENFFEISSEYYLTVENYFGAYMFEARIRNDRK